MFMLFLKIDIFQFYINYISFTEEVTEKVESGIATEDIWPLTQVSMKFLRATLSGLQLEALESSIRIK